MGGDQNYTKSRHVLKYPWEEAFQNLTILPCTRIEIFEQFFKISSYFQKPTVQKPGVGDFGGPLELQNSLKWHNIGSFRWTMF